MDTSNQTGNPTIPLFLGHPSQNRCWTVSIFYNILELIPYENLPYSPNVFVQRFHLLLAFAAATEKPNMKHIVVYQEDGKFAGWPANNGTWQFEGDDILVGFTRGDYQLNDGHNIGPEETQLSWVARSTDEGNSWDAYNPPNYVGDFGRIPLTKFLGKPIDFQLPDLP